MGMKIAGKPIAIIILGDQSILAREGWQCVHVRLDRLDDEAIRCIGHWFEHDNGITNYRDSRPQIGRNQNGSFADITIDVDFVEWVDLLPVDDLASKELWPDGDFSREGQTQD